MTSASATDAPANTPSTVCLVLDARTRVGDGPPTAAAAAATERWPALLSALYCQALLTATTAASPTAVRWSAIAIMEHEAAEGGAGAGRGGPSLSWLIRPPLSVSSLRELLQRCKLPLLSSAPHPPQPPPQSQQAAHSLSACGAEAEEFDPVLAALKEVLQQQQPSQLHSACHVVLLSSHLLSTQFVREPAQLVTSLHALGEQRFSFRLLHFRCGSEATAPPSPLFSQVQGAPHIRSSARSDGITSSAYRQPQQLWSVAASLQEAGTVRATLLVSSAADALLATDSLNTSECEAWRAGSEWREAGCRSDSGSETWQSAFEDQSTLYEARAVSRQVPPADSLLSLEVLLLPAVRTLPLPRSTQLCSTPTCDAEVVVPPSAATEQRPRTGVPSDSFEATWSDNGGSCQRCECGKGGVVLRGWRRVDLSSLTDSFCPLRDTAGGAWQVVAGDGQQQQQLLAALLHPLQRDEQTMLFHASGVADCRCRCHRRRSAVYALLVARDCSACWLQPHLVAEQSVLSGELNAHEQSLLHAASDAQAIQAALLRLPLSASAFNPTLYSSGWSECVTSIFDRAARVITASQKAEPAARRPRRILDVRGRDGEQTERSATQRRPLAMRAERGARVQQQAAAGQRGRGELHSAVLAELSSASSSTSDDSDASEPHIASASAKERSGGRQRAHVQRPKRERTSKRSPPPKKRTATTTPRAKRHSKGDTTAASRKKNTRGGKGSGSGSKGRKSARKGGRGRKKAHGKRGGSGDSDGSAEETETDSEKEWVGARAGAEWDFTVGNPKLESELQQLAEAPSSDRRSSLRLQHKQDAQRRQREEAKRQLDRIDQLAGERFRQRLAEQQRERQRAQQQPAAQHVSSSVAVTPAVSSEDATGAEAAICARLRRRIVLDDSADCCEVDAEQPPNSDTAVGDSSRLAMPALEAVADAHAHSDTRKAAEALEEVRMEELSDGELSSD